MVSEVVNGYYFDNRLLEKQGCVNELQNPTSNLTNTVIIKHYYLFKHSGYNLTDIRKRFPPAAGPAQFVEGQPIKRNL